MNEYSCIIAQGVYDTQNIVSKPNDLFGENRTHLYYKINKLMEAQPNIKANKDIIQSKQQILKKV